MNMILSQENAMKELKLFQTLFEISDH